MPLSFNLSLEDTTGGLISLWDVTESEEKLKELACLTQKEEEVFSKITSSARALEFLSIRALFKEMIGEKRAILYHSNGSPYIENSSDYISITHTIGKSGIYINPKKPCGIDIELSSRDASKIYDRVVNKKEAHLFPQSCDNLILLWVTKEALYKRFSDETLSLKDNVYIESISKESSSVVNRCEYLSKDKRVNKIIMSRYITVKGLSDYLLAWTI